MPNAAPKPCRHPGCRSLTTKGAYCDLHRRAKNVVIEAERGSSTARGYSYKWQKASKAFLKLHPKCECEECQAGLIRLRLSDVVDHKIPHRIKDALDSGDPARITKAQKLFWDQKNWQAMNKQCHDKKTATQDSGFAKRFV